MNTSGTITMSMTELDRLKVVQAVCERRLKPGQAADRLALSVRQVERLVQRYQAAGVAGLVSGRGRLRKRKIKHVWPATPCRKERGYSAANASSICRERLASSVSR